MSYGFNALVDPSHSMQRNTYTGTSLHGFHIWANDAWSLLLMSFIVLQAWPITQLAISRPDGGDQGDMGVNAPSSSFCVITFPVPCFCLAYIYTSRRALLFMAFILLQPLPETQLAISRPDGGDQSDMWVKAPSSSFCVITVPVPCFCLAYIYTNRWALLFISFVLLQPFPETQVAISRPEGGDQGDLRIRAPSSRWSSLVSQLVSRQGRIDLKLGTKHDVISPIYGSHVGRDQCSCSSACRAVPFWLIQQGVKPISHPLLLYCAITMYRRLFFLAIFIFYNIHTIQIKPSNLDTATELVARCNKSLDGLWAPWWLMRTTLPRQATFVLLTSCFVPSLMIFANVTKNQSS